MRESAYLAALSTDIEKEIGGKVIKTSDRSTLGLPDSQHVMDGILTAIETKISDAYTYIDEVLHVEPWKTIKKDLRQFEVCRALAKHICVVYAIYYPEVQRSLVIPVELLTQFRPNESGTYLYLNTEKYLRRGRGISQLKEIISEHRKAVYGRLSKRVSL